MRLQLLPPADDASVTTARHKAAALFNTYQEGGVRMVNRKGSGPPHDEIVNQPDGLPPKTTMIQPTIVS